MGYTKKVGSNKIKIRFESPFDESPLTTVNGVTSSITSTQLKVAPATRITGQGMFISSYSFDRASQGQDNEWQETKKTHPACFLSSLSDSSLFAFSSSSPSQNLANPEPDPISTSIEIGQGTQGEFLTNSIPLAMFFFKLQDRRVKSQEKRDQDQYQLCDRFSSSRFKKRGTYSGRQAARSSSSSAESEPTEWIFSTPEVCRRHHPKVYTQTEGQPTSSLTSSSTPPP
jgi:hypothetical protein